MQIQVQLFSILRNCLPPGASRGRASVTLPDGATLADLVRHLGIDRYLGLEASEVSATAGWQILVANRYEPDMDRVLQEGELVLILPAVSGG